MNEINKWRVGLLYPWRPILHWGPFSLSLSLSLSCEGIVSSAIANQHSGECAFVTVRVTKVLDDGAVEFCVHRGQEFSYWVYRS
jgi:hypothetical protein